MQQASWQDIMTSQHWSVWQAMDTGQSPLGTQLHCVRPFFSLQVSMTFPRSPERAQVAIPAQGMIELRDALTDLLNEYGSEDEGM